MFNLFSQFSSKAGLPDDETIVQFTKPFFRFSLSDTRTVAAYRTKTRTLLTCGIYNYSVYGWLPKHCSRATIKAAVQIYLNGFDSGWECCEAFEKMMAEGAAQRAAWLALPEEERRLYEYEDPELVQYYRDHPEEGVN
jgi:hypothetical protein